MGHQAAWLACAIPRITGFFIGVIQPSLRRIRAKTVHRRIIRHVLIFIKTFVMEKAQQLTTPLLRHLISAGLVGELRARGVSGGFLLVIKQADTEFVLAAQRGSPRVFRRLDTLAGYLKEQGGRSLVVELDEWDGPGTEA